MKLIIQIATLLLILTACSDPLEKPARDSQIEKIKEVLEMYPELKALYAEMESDGVVTKGEILEIAASAKKLKESREKQPGDIR